MKSQISQKILPFLWFENQAEEAIRFYISIFPDSHLEVMTRWPDETPFPDGSSEPGKVKQSLFSLAGTWFAAFDAGPLFKFNPSISFFVNCESEQEVEEIFTKLAEGGQTLMPLDKYPFSDKYGWIQDRYGVSWQVMLNNAEKARKIYPSLMFVQENAGRAEEALRFYTTLFDNSQILSLNRYGAGMLPDTENSVAYGECLLGGELFAAMDSAQNHSFQFGEAISLYVNCKDQAEIDFLWDRLTRDGAESACGWLKDPYGVSWQIVPQFLQDILVDGTEGNEQAMMQAMSQMRKLDEAALRAAFF